MRVPHTATLLGGMTAAILVVGAETDLPTAQTGRHDGIPTATYAIRAISAAPQKFTSAGLAVRFSFAATTLKSAVAAMPVYAALHPSLD
jgi:hypothetical protein